MSSALTIFDLEIVTPKDLGIEGEPDESFPTLQENAISKARFYCQKSGGIPTLAEDTGLFIDALQGELGVMTRRWGAGPTATDDEWLDYFVQRMRLEENRDAKFMCVMAYIDEDGNASIFEGVCAGSITREASCTRLPNLPLSSVFLPEGFDRVFADLTHDEKNAISHRGRALQNFIESTRQSALIPPL